MSEASEGTNNRLGMGQRRRATVRDATGERTSPAPRSSGRKKKQNRRIPGKSSRQGYTQASAHIREDVYDHVAAVIRSDAEIREMLQRRCIELGVEPGGGKPRYGYSELVEMLLVQWAEEEAEQPVP